MRTAPWPSPRVPRPLTTPLYGCRRSASFVFEARRRKGSPWPVDEGLASPRFWDEPRVFAGTTQPAEEPREPGARTRCPGERAKANRSTGRNLGRGGRADKQDGIMFQVSLGQSRLRALRPGSEEPPKESDEAGLPSGHGEPRIRRDGHRSARAQEQGAGSARPSHCLQVLVDHEHRSGAILGPNRERARRQGASRAAPATHGGITGARPEERGFKRCIPGLGQASGVVKPRSHRGSIPLARRSR